MAKTPEGRLKRAIVARLKQRGCKVLVTTGVAQAGTPDLVACWHGRCLALEVKTHAGRTTPLQQHELDAWAGAGAWSAVVRTVDDVDRLLESIT